MIFNKETVDQFEQVKTDDYTATVVIKKSQFFIEVKPKNKEIIISKGTFTLKVSKELIGYQKGIEYSLVNSNLKVEIPGSEFGQTTEE